MTVSPVCAFPRICGRGSTSVDLHHSIRDGGMHDDNVPIDGNENTTCETFMFCFRIPTSFASEKIGQILRLEYSTQAVLIRKAGIEYRTLYSVYA